MYVISTAEVLTLSKSEKATTMATSAYMCTTYNWGCTIFIGQMNYRHINVKFYVTGYQPIIKLLADE